MEESVYQLVPFGESSKISGLEFRAKVARTETGVSILFSLHAPPTELDKILWPSSNGETSVRKDELWKTTCFEAFIGPRDSQDYFEFNVAPSGDWNVYHFDSYRSGMKTVLPEMQTSPLKSHARSANSRELVVAIDSRHLKLEGALALGVTAVLEFRGGEKEYWALSHRGARPDFHLRSSWELA